MAVISCQNVEGHIEAHSVGRTRRPMAVNTADRDARGKINNVNAGSLERLLCQIPIGHETDLMDVQSGGECHPLTPDIASKGEHGSQHLAPAYCWGQARGAVTVQEVTKEVRPGVPVAGVQKTTIRTFTVEGEEK